MNMYISYINVQIPKHFILCNIRTSYVFLGNAYFAVELSTVWSSDAEQFNHAGRRHSLTFISFD